MSTQLTPKAIAESIGCCGLVCAFCSEGKSGCQGCKAATDGCSDKDRCQTKQCCQAKGLEGCWECGSFPCGGEMQKSHRVRAFLRCAKDEGVDGLAAHLYRNHCDGIHYHGADATRGDYDMTDSEEQVLTLLRNGRK